MVLTFLFLQLCKNKCHHRIYREKIHNHRIFKSYFRTNWAAWNAKTVLRERSNYGNPGSNYGFMANPSRKSLKRFQMHQGCVLFDSDSDGTIYFGLSAGMEEIWAIFHLCRWFETTPEGGNPHITPSFLQIGRNKWYHLIQRNKIPNPDVFEIISRIRRPKTGFWPVCVVCFGISAEINKI